MARKVSLKYIAVGVVAPIVVMVAFAAGFMANRFTSSSTNAVGRRLPDELSAKVVEPSAILSLPNALGQTHGFTCTGLAYDNNEDVFWMGNFGVEEPHAKNTKPSIIKLNKDLEIEQEIFLYDIGISNRGVGLQGIAYDQIEDTLWICADGAIYNIAKKGAIIDSINLEDSTLVPNGIAYDVQTDTLWVLCYHDFLLNISKNGQMLHSIPCDVRDQDQLAFSRDGKLWFTAGADYKGELNWLYNVDTQSGAISAIYQLHGSYAVEGALFLEDKLYILNDGYYHEALDPKNMMVVYKL